MSDTQPTNLYTLSEAIRAESERIAEMMERTNGDDAFMTSEDKAARDAFIEGLRTEAGLKADGYARMILELETRAKLRSAEAVVLQERLSEMREMALSEQARADRYKRFVMSCMERAGMKRLEGATFTLAVQANGGKQPVEVIEGVELPDRFVNVEVTRKPNRDAIRDALLAGDAEAIQYATLRERGFTLRIK